MVGVSLGTIVGVLEGALVGGCDGAAIEEYLLVRLPFIITFYSRIAKNKKIKIENCEKIHRVTSFT